MRALLLGSDFMYNSNGELIPIELNTNVGFNIHTVEPYEDIFDLSDLRSFVITNNIIKISYIGSIEILSKKISEMCEDINLEYSYLQVKFGSVTVPYIEDDNENHLIIRSSYDMMAVIDEVYCKNKINFLNLIKDKPFGTEFAYLDDSGILINNITSIQDNGNHPNFILKSILPLYDRNEYPKLFKVSNQEELNVILSNVNESFFLMKFHYNPLKLYENHIVNYRSLNIIFPPNLQSFPIGKYKRLTTRNVDELTTFDPITFEINWDDRTKYITSDAGFNSPKLLDNDQVEMADGTFKTGADLEIGDVVKTIIVYNPNNVDLGGDLTNYHISYDEFMSGSTYSTNTILNKVRVDKLTEYVTIKFTDGTDWGDTQSSSYLVLKNNEVRFIYLNVGEETLEIGDEIILVDTNFDEFTTILKTVSSIEITKIIFSGWEITVEGEHIFLTKTEDETSQSYAAIEHNDACTVYSPPNCSSGNCIKPLVCQESRLNCACDIPA